MKTYLKGKIKLLLLSRPVWYQPGEGRGAEVMKVIKESEDLVGQLHKLKAEKGEVNERRDKIILELLLKLKEKPDAFTPGLLKKLAEWEKFKPYVAGNPNISSDTLIKLLNDKDPLVRFSALLNKDVFKKLPKAVQDKYRPPEMEKLIKIMPKKKETELIDDLIYRPGEDKGKLEKLPYVPGKDDAVMELLSRGMAGQKKGKKGKK